MICLSILGAIGGLVLVQRLVSTEWRRQHNDVAGFIYAVLGVAYAVLLGLVLIAVWEQWDAAQVTADDEASEVAEVFWIAHQLPQPQGRHIQELEPTTGAQLMLYNQALDRMHDLSGARRERLLDAREGLPSILWIVLIVGGVIAVGFTYLFGLEHTFVHVLMVAALALVISLALFTVAALDYPFKGDVRVGPAAFQQVLGGFESSNLSDL